MSEPPPHRVDLSIVVLAWNQLELTQRCVASIRDHTDASHELIIVDNGSAAEAARWADESADKAVLHDSNLGFAKGMNAGLAVATGDAVAFVNNDTELPEAWASRLLETLRSPGGHAGIVVPALTSAGNQSTVRSAPSDRVSPTLPFRDLPSGVVYVMESEVMRALGGWDERYPIASAEDLDLIFTVWSNGLEVVLDERVLVDHVGGATADTQLPGKERRWRENRRILVDRWSDIEDGTVPRLVGVSDEQRASRLEQARIAASWMRRAFVAEDRLAAGAAPSAATTVTSKGLIHRIQHRLRRALRPDA
jgi:GT2 family glycosyltransferase